MTRSRATAMFTIMIYIRVLDKYDAKAFLALAKSGSPVVCLPDNTYGIREEHLKILKRNRISFKKIDPSKVRVPQPALAV